MNIIYTRSPKMVTIAGTSGDIAEVELYVWATGSMPSTPTYTLEKQIVNSANEAYFNISPFIKESIAHTEFFAVGSIGNFLAPEYVNVFVQPKLNSVNLISSTYIATDGYEDYHTTASRNNVFLTEGSYYYATTGDRGAIYIYDESTTSTEIKYTGLQSGSVQTLTMTSLTQKATYVHSTMIDEGNKVEVIEDGTEIATYYFLPVCEPKHTLHQCDFINKHGMWQRLTFFKASKTTLEVQGNTFNMMLDSPNYTSYQHKRQDFNKQGQRSINLNTGWVSDFYAEVIQDLAMSEQVLLDGLPVNLDTNSIEMLEGINVGNINYNLTFKYATPVINKNT